MTVAEIMLWGSRIGTVALGDNAHIAEFEYDRNFMQSGIEVSPFMMPLSDSVYSFSRLPTEAFHGLPGLLADSLPDKFGNMVIDAWLLRQGRPPESFNAVERLCYTGSRGMGALEFVPAIGPNRTADRTIQVNELTKLASDILAKREQIHLQKSDHTMEDMIRIGTSAGGARAKAVIAWNETTGEVRSGQVDAGNGFGYFLLKFDGVENNRDKEKEDAPCYTRIEYAYHLMAKRAGISMMECRLYHEGGRQHFLTRRFDRDEKTGAKIHIQTLGALLHIDYNEPAIYSYEQAAHTMMRMRLGQNEVEELYRRMVFNVLAWNCDDHVKNFTFLMDKRGRWTLSPAYDVTYAYNPDGLWTGGHQMTVNGKRNGITEDDLLQTAGHINISRAKAKKIITAVREAISNWLSYAGQAGVPEREASAIEKQIQSGAKTNA